MASSGPAEFAPVSPSSTDPATTAQPAAPGSQGPIPFDVHHTALQNARAKERDAALSEWRQQHGWAEHVDRASVERMAQVAQLYQQDRPGYIRQILAEAVQDPTLAPLVRSEAARLLGQRQAAPVDLSPDIPVLDEQGRVVAQSYSADRLKQVLQAEIAKALGEKVDPLLQERQERQTREQQAADQRAMETEVQRVFDTVSQLPHYADHEAAIAARMAQFPKEVSATEAALLAYVHVVIPHLGATERKAVLASLSTNAAGGTVNPSGATVAQTPKFKSHREALAYYAEHPAEAEAMASR
jgi:hypothetical protein